MPKRVVSGSIIAFVAVAVVAIVAYRQNEELYLTVQELAARQGELRSATSVASLLADSRVAAGTRRLRVRGTLIDFTVGDTADGQGMQLTLGQGSQRLRVVYRGPKPDSLARAQELTVAGWLANDGTFVADSLTVQCPSKYEPQATGTASGAALPLPSPWSGRPR